MPVAESWLRERFTAGYLAEDGVSARIGWLLVKNGGLTHTSCLLAGAAARGLGVCRGGREFPGDSVEDGSSPRTLWLFAGGAP